MLSEAGITTDMPGPYEYIATGDPSLLPNQVVTFLGAAGGLTGIAAILKTFFGRHKGIMVKFGEDGKVLEVSGLSVDDIVRLLDRCSPPAHTDDVVESLQFRQVLDDPELSDDDKVRLLFGISPPAQTDEISAIRDVSDTRGNEDSAASDGEP